MLEAADVLDAYDRVVSLAAGRRRPPTDTAAAERLQHAVTAMRRSRGERPLGRKIGFTNRSIWPLYGVHQPIWAPVWDSTVVMLGRPESTVVADRFVEPRLEPEIVLHLARSPASAQLADVAAAIDWVAHGFEIVDSPWPGWKFDAAQAICAQSLHGALLVGPPAPVASLGGPAALADVLGGLRLALSRDGHAVAAGAGSAVLDGPVQALAHLVAALAQRGERLDAGELITTGTLTDAQPLAAGQRWSTQIDDAALPGLTLHVA